MIWYIHLAMALMTAAFIDEISDGGRWWATLFTALLWPIAVPVLLGSYLGYAAKRK